MIKGEDDIKKNDIKLIGVVVILSLLAILAMNLLKKEGNELVVMLDGQVYETIDLNKDGIYTVTGENGSVNIFEIKNGYADMIEASCPDQLCVHQRDIHYNNESITCLPNKVVLKVKSQEESEIDIMAE